MAADCSYFRSSTALKTDCVLYCAADGSGLLIPPLVNGFPDGLRVVLLSRRQRIAHSSARQQLSRRFARHRLLAVSLILPLVDVNYPRPVCVPYSSADGSGLLILPLVNGFHDGLRAVLLSGWYRIGQSSARQLLSRRFARRKLFAVSLILPLVDVNYPRPVCVPYSSADGSGLLILPLVNGFHDGLRAILPSGWQRIAHTSAHQRLSRRFARRIALRMAADCSIFRLPTAFNMVCAPYSSADGIELPPPPLTNGFHDDLRAVLLSGWHRIAHTSASQRLSRRFARCIAQRMAADCSIFHSPTAFTTVCALYSSAPGIGLRAPPLANDFHDDLRAVLHTGWRGGSLILSLVNGFHEGLCAVLLSGWQRIAHTSGHQRLSRWFARRIAQRMAAHCSFFRSSTAFRMVRAPYCAADGGGLLIPPLVNGLPDGLRAVLLSGRQRIAHSSAHQQLSRWFACRIA